MKCFRPFFISLAFGLMLNHAVYAQLGGSGTGTNQYIMQSDDIPKVISFSPGQTKAEILFPKTSLPAQFHCYFEPLNNKQYRGLSAHFISDNAEMTDALGNDTTLAGGGGDVKILNLSPISGKKAFGNIKIDLEGPIKVPVVRIMCAMSKQLS